MDLTILNLLNGLTNKFDFLDNTIVFLASTLVYVFGALFLLIFFWPRSFGFVDRIPVTLAIFSGFFARIFKELVVVFYNRPRPFSELEDIVVLIEKESFSSFPSGHAIFFFALITPIFIFNRKLGIISFIFAFLMGMSRVISGVHWPSDILAGASVGILIGVSVYYLRAVLYRFLGNFSKGVLGKISLFLRNI